MNEIAITMAISNPRKKRRPATVKNAENFGRFSRHPNIGTLNQSIAKPIVCFRNPSPIIARPKSMHPNRTNLHLTRIRRENPAFNCRFFRPNPLAFEGEAGKNAGHDAEFSSRHRNSQSEIISANRLKAFARGGASRAASENFLEESVAESSKIFTGNAQSKRPLRRDTATNTRDACATPTFRRVPIATAEGRKCWLDFPAHDFSLAKWG